MRQHLASRSTRFPRLFHRSKVRAERAALRLSVQLSYRACTPDQLQALLSALRQALRQYSEFGGEPRHNIVPAMLQQLANCPPDKLPQLHANLSRLPADLPWRSLALQQLAASFSRALRLPLASPDQPEVSSGAAAPLRSCARPTPECLLKAYGQHPSASPHCYCRAIAESQLAPYPD